MVYIGSSTSDGSRHSMEVLEHISSRQGGPYVVIGHAFVP